MGLGSGLFSNQRAQRPHLVRGGGGLAGEVADLRSDVSDEMEVMAAIAIEEFIDPAAADIDAIRLAAVVDNTGVRTLSGADLDGVVGEAEMVPPRNITVDTTGVTPADAPATVTINGKVRNGKGILIAQTEVITVSQIVGQAVGALAFSEVDEIVEAQADGTAASLSYGFGDVFGLGKPIKSRAGLAGLIREVAAGVLVTTGTVVDAATGIPNGTYEPATPADATNDYAVYYEWDPTV